MLDREFLDLVAGLWLGQQSLEAKFREHSGGVGRGVRARYNRDAARRHLASIPGEVARLSAAIAAETNAAIVGLAATEPAAARVTRGTEQLLDLAADLREQAVPSEFVPARDLAARLVDRPLYQIADFVEESVAALGHEEAMRGLRLRLSLKTALVAEFDRALAAAQGSRQ